MERDQQVITEMVMNEATALVWKERSLPEELVVAVFDDPFRIEVVKRTSKFAMVRILRIHAP